MAVVRYTTPKGLDREIDMIQVKLYDYLISKGWTNYTCYPRCYVNAKNGKNVIEYTLNNKDYKDVMFNDSVNASSLFVLINSNKKDIRLEKATLALIFQINQTKISPATTTRQPDEDIINEITRFLYKLPYSINLTNVKRGIKNVYSDLAVEMSNKNEIGSSMVCRFDLELHYTLNEPITRNNTII